MKNLNINLDDSSVLGTVLLIVLLLIIFGCIFGYSCFKQRESFESGCLKNKNFNDPKFLNERFFHYDNIDNLIPSDPVHVPRGVVQTALLSSSEVTEHFGNAKKKTQ